MKEDITQYLVITRNIYYIAVEIPSRAVSACGPLYFTLYFSSTTADLFS